MRKINLLVLYIIVALSSSASGDEVIQVPIDIVISAVDHPGETFALPSRSSTRAIYYPGEEVKLGIGLLNYGTGEVWLNLPETKVTEHFIFRWLETPDERVRSMMAFEPGLMYWGRDFKPSARIEKVTKLPPQGAISIQWSLTWRDVSSRAPGHYEFEATYVVPPKLRQLLERSGKDIIVHGARFQFELREPTTLEDRLEVLYRAAVRAYLNKDYDKAVTNLKELLAIYPNSSAAYSLLGRIHFDTGDYMKAITHDQKAIDLLASGTDVIRLKYWAAGHNKDHIIAVLRGRIEVAKQRLHHR